MLDSPKSGHGPSLAKFNWEDPFGLAAQLSDDERMILEAAASYAADKLVPRVDEMYLEESVIPEIFGEMGEMGLLGITIPEEWGLASCSQGECSARWDAILVANSG